MTTNRTRRRLLQMGGAAAGAAVAGVFGRAPRAAAADLAAAAREPQTAAAKRVALFNLHTGEQLDVEFFRGGYVADSLAAIQVLLRDFRNDEQHPIDPRLMDYLHDVARHAGVDPVFSVISGYRSPQTNEQLRERSSGVARHSLHLEGRAIDVRLAGVHCADLAGRALDLTRGGVGFYAKSDFVHLDTGAFRTWKG
jgi:uncharacterized protein YcbK (DUF882 family)